MQIIVLQNQEQFGPFDLNQLQSIVNEGHFQLTDYCWAQEWSEWKLLSTVVNRFPPALKSAIPLPSVQIFEQPFSEPVFRGDTAEDLPQASNIEELASHSPITIDNKNLKAGMVVRNESQSVSCDFVTSLAVRGVYVRSKPKGEDFNFSSEAALHIARGQEILGCYNVVDIIEYIGSGFLFTTDLFWNESAGEWLELSQIQQQKPSATARFSEDAGLLPQAMFAAISAAEGDLFV